ncbi:MAG: isoprenylcysteine carboxylmethyltransferase family protein [Methylacidiphilales bacterium]|nr:isoprenylcysteine carboxylmethyltransferase family protein [Candidatus Methylacidiphilales bacterium]
MTWGFLILGLWLSWIAYWLISAIGNKATERRESSLSQLSHKLPLFLGGTLLAAPHWFSYWLSQRFLPHSLIFAPFGAVILVLGLSFTIWARVHLGANWSGIVTLKKDHELIRTGPYGWVRHPIYSGILLAILGTVIAIGEWRGLLALACITFGFVCKIQTEERWMGEAFGPRYALYIKEVYALIPGIY